MEGKIDMRIKGKEIINRSVVGIDLGEKKSAATYPSRLMALRRINLHSQ
jgi:hypothetical protein